MYKKILINLVFLLLLIGFCQGYDEDDNDDLFDNKPISTHFLRGMHTFGIIGESSRQIWRQILRSAIDKNKTQLVFRVLHGNCDAPNYKEVQEGVINILKSKLVGLRITVNTTSNEIFTCYENIKAEW